MSDDGPRPRWHPFRIAQGDHMDPDLHQPPAPDWKHTGAAYATETSAALDEAHRAVRERSSAAVHLLTVTCLPSHECGSAGAGAELATVWRTSHGFLYLARLMADHDHSDREREASGRFVRVRHPVTGGVADVGRRAFETVWEGKGWELAPPGTELVRRWQPQWGFMVRDLLDRDDLDHVPLRSKCARGGELPPIDRLLLLAQLARASRGSDSERARRAVRRVPVDQIVRVS